LNSKKNLDFRSGTNYSSALHQDGEKPVLFVPYFFRERLGFFLNWRKQRPEDLKPFAGFNAKSLRKPLRGLLFAALVSS
jgi:hypothetical protein